MNSLMRSILSWKKLNRTTDSGWHPSRIDVAWYCVRKKRCRVCWDARNRFIRTAHIRVKRHELCTPLATEACMIEYKDRPSARMSGISNALSGDAKLSFRATTVLRSAFVSLPRED